MYKCPRCGYVTDKINNYKSHINRKKLCISRIKDISRNELFIDLDKQKNKDVDEDKIYECEYCNKEFSSLSNKYRHKKICKSNSEQKINNLGVENMDSLSHQLLRNYLINVNFRDLLTSLHYNDNFPENKNINLISIKRNIMEIYKNDKWNTMSVKDGLLILINHGYIIFKKFYSKNKEEIRNRYINIHEISKIFGDIKKKIDRTIERKIDPTIEQIIDPIINPILKELKLMIEENR